MSWVKSASLNSEDVFDENADELKLQSKEWTSNMKKRVKDGYVDGVDAGQEASLQAGFNLGFKEGAAQTVAVGRLRGILGAVWCWCQIQHPEKPVPTSVTDLLQRVTEHESQIMEDIRRALENPPPSVSDISESMDALEVEQEDPCHCKDGGNGPCCSKRDENMDVDNPIKDQTICSGSISCSSSSGESLNLLLQHCVDLVSELGLPQELIDHINELRSINQPH
ncbi:OTU deubiquitinase with linear linkage specificity a [Oryzias melastigma]|uniref:OTU deubiquitinase with linear linkage specificity a n=1 Tax=Oryzias melastigma TaxID=30732 RepID=A0A3B3CX36_ORYME|nr:OTU deubiquitinase with linear linkage specificity a [Oryzias melastigma]